MGKLRWKIVILLTVGCSLASVGWFVLHRYQMRRMNGVFLEQSTRAEEAKHPDRAARFLRQYLLINRGSVDARARYGMLLEKLATTPRARNDALSIYEEVITADPARIEIRQRAAKLGTEIGRPDVALVHLKNLQADGYGDEETEFLIGKCFTMKAEFNEAEKHFRKAIGDKKGSERIDAFLVLADILRGPLKKPNEAATVLEDLVAKNPKIFRAYLSRAVFLQAGGAKADRADALPILGASTVAMAGSQAGQGPMLAASALIGGKNPGGGDLVAAEQDLVVARQLAPDNPDVLLASGTQRLIEAAASKNDADKKRLLAEAREFLEQAVKLRPDNPRIHLQLAAAELIAGRPAEAVAVLRAGQKKVSGKGRLELLWELADLLAAREEFAGADEVVEQMKMLRYPAARLDFLRARLAARQGNWYKAAGLLEEARPMLVDDRKLVIRADLLLGQCFEQMGDADRQLLIYRRASHIDRLEIAPRLGVMNALLSLGRLDDAIEECQQLIQMGKAPASTAIFLSRLLILQNFNLPAQSQRWEQVENVLDMAAQANKESAEPEVLRAEILLAKKEPKKARELLIKTRTAFPKEADPWIALAFLASREGSLDEARRILGDASKALGDLTELRLAKLRLMPSKKEEGLAYLRPLTDGVERFDRAAQARLFFGLAIAYGQADDLHESEKWLLRLAGLEPNKLRVRLQLFDLYLRTNDQAGMERTVKVIRHIEGTGGPLSAYGEAYLLIWQTRQGKTGLTADARAYLMAAAAKRPRWARVPLALASVAELEGNTDLSIEHYRSALLLGDRQPDVVRKLAELLIQRRQYAEAEETIRKLEESTAISGKLQMLAAEISVYNLNPERALDLAEKAIAKGSSDYRDYMWQGHILWSVGKYERAEKAFDKAIELAGNEIAPYVAQVEFFARTQGQDAKKAHAVIAKLRKGFPATKLSLALGRCHEVLGDNKEAEKYYKEAQATDSKNVQILEGVANFYQRTGQPGKAEPVLRRLLEPTIETSAPLAAWARRNLALSLGLSGGSREQADQVKALIEAMGLIEKNLKAQANSLEDQLVKGILLATKSESRGEAIALLEKAFKLKQPTADQEFVLANLYYAEGDWPKARTQMVRVLSKHAKHPNYPRFVGIFAERLLERNQVGEAKVWAEQLRNVEPHKFATYAIWARYQAARGAGAESLAAVSAYLADKESEPIEVKATDGKVRVLLAAKVLEGLAARYPPVSEQLLPEAENMLRGVVEKFSDTEGRFALAGFLARQKRVAEALDVCETALKDAPVEQVATVAVATVATNIASKSQMQRVDGWLQAARKQKPKMFELLLHQAVLRERQERFADAEALYRHVLAAQPRNVVAANNLAFLLGLLGKEDEALRLMQIAIDVAGPGGELLDSRAAILLAAGKRLEAEKDLTAGLRQEKSGTLYFHLAQACAGAGQNKKAIEAFAEARRLGIHVDTLHPLERDAYRALAKIVVSKTQK